MKLLLHACCAPCSSAVLEYIDSQGIKPVIYYYNPNIYPLSEYEKRRDEIVDYAQKIGVEIIVGEYNHDEWLKSVRGHEGDDERRGRCLLCFKMRLLNVATMANSLGFDSIATTLSSSRWKRLDQIDAAGFWATTSFPNVCFLAKNWRKNGLQNRRYELLKQNNFYNQLYCGCEFSIKQD